MKRGVMLLRFVVATLVVVNAQQYKSAPNFPSYNCEMFESPYRLSSTAKAFGGGKYCFTLNVVPTPGCTSHCCTKADVKNMEFDVRKECKARGMAVKVTVNGAPTVMGANFDLSDHGPLGRTILRLTQLGLGLDSNGTEVCITLVTNNADNGCTTLEELCMPPPGQPAGICSAVLFNTQLDCCPISNVNTPNPMAPVVLALPLPSPPLQSLPSPSVLPLLPAPPPPRLSFSFSIASRPPSPPSPPSSPLPSPPLPSAPPSYSSPPFLSPPFPLLASASNPLPTPTPCTFCTYLTITPRNPLYPINITKSQCYIFVEIVVADIVARAQMEDAILRSDSPAISCANNQVKICGLFASDAEGAKLQPWIEARVTGWLSIVTDLATCPAFLNGYDVAVATGGDGQWPNLPASCLNATRTVACRPQEIPFPKFACNTRQRITPFAALPVIFKAQGRKNTTTLYCFTTDTFMPDDINSSCGSTTTLLKAEIWANETQRHKVIAVGVQPGNSDTLSFRAVTWGAKGEQTLKVTPLNWNTTQAKGGKICLEVDDSTTLTTLCNGVLNTCWINFFSPTKKCCPLYAASFAG